MFPIPWNFPLRKKNGNLVNIGDAIDEGSELPEHGTSDAGKVLSVDENGDLEWSDEVPAHVEADAGKLLSVDESGELEWSDEVPQAIQTLTNNLSDEVEVRAELGAHNLYKFDLAVAKAANTSGTWNDNVYTVSGATFTVNDDDTITVNTNGTTTQELYFKVGTASLENGKQYKILGCPSGGSNNSYLMAYKKDNSTYAIDTGNGASFTYASTDDKSIEIYIRSGQNLVDAVFKPMICVSTDKATTYQPYAMTNRELTESVNGLKMKHIIKQITLTANDTTVLDLSNDFALPSGSAIQSLQLALSVDNTMNSSSLPLPYCHLSTGDVKTWVERYNSDGSNVKIINLTSAWTNYYLHVVAFYT